jgi:hypothetical protein
LLRFNLELQTLFGETHMPASAKSLALVKELRDRMARRTTLAVGDLAYDTDGGAYFLIGAGTAGTQSMLIKGKQIDPVGFDIFGAAARGYAQTVLQVVLETSTIASTPLLTGANMLPLIGEVLRQGSRVELYMSTNTDNVGVDEIIAGQLVQTWEPDLQYRTMDAQ